MKYCLAIIALSIIIISCSQQEPVQAVNEPTPVNTQETWEDYLYSAIENRNEVVFFTQYDFEISLDEYKKLPIEKDPSQFDYIGDAYEASYFIDIDDDGVDELYVITCEGSIRQHYGNVFKKKDNAYVQADRFEGRIFPVKYNSEVHFISLEYNFETKFIDAIIEYEVNGLAFKPEETLIIQYTYDVSKLPEPVKSMIDNDSLSSLSNYEVMSSNIASITQIPEQSSLNVQLVDNKHKNRFDFNIHLWLTTVGYAPNQWEITSGDDATHSFRGMDQIESNEENNTDGSIDYGYKFYKDDSDQVFLLKISYPYYTVEERKDGDLTLELFKFNQDSVERVVKIRIEPTIEVQKEAA